MGYRSVVTRVAGNVDASKVVTIDKEHVLVLWDSLEAIGIVWEVVGRISGASVAQKDALHLLRIGMVEAWVISHDVAVGCIRDENELSLWKRLEKLHEEVLADAQRCTDIAKVQGSGVETSSWIVGEDELFVVARDLHKMR